MFIEVFPHLKNTPSDSNKYYEWKFNSYPFKINSFDFCGLEKNQILAYYAAVPHHYKIEGSTYLAGMVCDIMVSENYFY